MKSLESVQNVFKVFMILSKIALIFCVAMLIFSLAALIWAAVGAGNGTVLGIETAAFLSMMEVADINQLYGCLLVDLGFVIVDIVLLWLSYRYFKSEQADGTPFTQGGADRLKTLGILVIVLPILAAIFGTVIYGGFDIELAEDWSNEGTLVLGIVMLISSAIFRYGAELEEKAQLKAETE